MAKAGKIVLLIVCAILLVLAAIFVYYRWIMKNNILDGPDSAYTWTDHELYSDWVEIDPPDWREPVRLTFEANHFKMTSSGWEEIFGYVLPEGTEVCGLSAGEVYLTLTDCTEFENLIFHEEQVGGEVIPILSGTTFEYDGRGEIVVAEFVRTEDADRLPADYRSASCIERNDRESVSTLKRIDEQDETE